MSYLVLARKYRPQTFDEIVGQEHVTRTLANAIASGRVHHAFLFCGARGVGKTTAARILAKCLSCVNAPTATPCNECDACREITAGTSVDVQEIDGASNNGVDDIRTLRESIRYLPVRGKKKVYIIDEVHMLSTGAFNALLKTLEEPPAHALFIFATTEVHKVPVTILSRVQRYDFKLVPSARIVSHLEHVLADEKVETERGALSLVAREAAGSVRDSLSLLEQVLATADGQRLTEATAAAALGVADRGLVEDLGKAILARDAATALSLVGTACERAYDVKHLADVLAEHLRDLVVARVVKDPAPLVEASEQELEALIATAKAAPSGLLELLFDRFVLVAQAMAEAPWPRYVMEVGLVELCRIEPLEPVGQLVDRLERMEARLESGAAAPRRVEAPRPVVAPQQRSAPPAPRPVENRPAASQQDDVRPPPDDEDPRPRAQPSGPPAPVARPRDWEGVATALMERSPKFAIFLTGEPVEFAPPRIVLAFKSDFEANMARQRLPDALPHLKVLVGDGVDVEVREGAPGVAAQAQSVIAAEERRAAENVKQRREEAVAHPARKLVTEVFGEGVIFHDPEVE